MKLVGNNILIFQMIGFLIAIVIAAGVIALAVLTIFLISKRIRKKINKEK